MKVTTGKAKTKATRSPKQRKAVEKAEGTRVHIHQLDDGSYMTETHKPPKNSGKGGDMSQFQPPDTASYPNLAGVHGHLDQSFAPPTPGSGTGGQAQGGDDEAAEGE
jgi:hypothetical protein